MSQPPADQTPSGPPSYGQDGSQQYPSAPQYGQAPQYAAPQYGGSQYLPVPQDPGKTLGIVGLVLSFFGFFAIAGLIVSIIARVKSKKAGFKNGLALAGIIVSSVVIVASVVATIFFFVAVGNVVDKCNDIGPGETYVHNGVPFTCP